MAKSVFFSFHYDRDHWRVQQVIQMGALEGQAILNAQAWEAVKRKGSATIEKWIREQMAYKSAVVVLVGRETASRPWVDYEIRHAWDNRKPLVGIRIHGLQNRVRKTDSPGPNPFMNVRLQGGGTVGNFVPLYEPAGMNSQAIYADISKNLSTWVEHAYRRN